MCSRDKQSLDHNKSFSGSTDVFLSFREDNAS